MFWCCLVSRRLVSMVLGFGVFESSRCRKPQAGNWPAVVDNLWPGSSAAMLSWLPWHQRFESSTSSQVFFPHNSKSLPKNVFTRNYAKIFFISRKINSKKESPRNCEMKNWVIWHRRWRSLRPRRRRGKNPPGIAHNKLFDKSRVEAKKKSSLKCLICFERK